MAAKLQVRFDGGIPPPPGVTPNFDNPTNIGPPLLGVGAVFVAIMFVFLAIRIYVKAKIVRKSSPDDCKSCRSDGHILEFGLTDWRVQTPVVLLRYVVHDGSNPSPLGEEWQANDFSCLLRLVQ